MYWRPCAMSMPKWTLICGVRQDDVNRRERMSDMTSYGARAQLPGRIAVLLIAEQPYQQYWRKHAVGRTMQTIAMIQVPWRWNATPCKYAKQSEGELRFCTVNGRNAVNEEPKEVLAIEKGGMLDNAQSRYGVQTILILVLYMQSSATVGLVI